MDTITSQTISASILPAAVKAAVQFAGKGKRCPDRFKAVSIQSRAGSLIVETANTDDGGTFARLTLSAPGIETGAVCLSESAAALLVKGGETTIHSDDDSVTVGTTTFLAGAHPGSGSPPAGETRCAAVPWSAWATAAAAVVSATDEESSRYALGGVRLEIAGKRANWIGTDGRRLHLLTTPATSGDDVGLLLRAGLFSRLTRSVETIGRAIVGAGGKKLAAELARSSIVITTNGTTVELLWQFDGASLLVTTTELQGRFPRWKDVFPNRPDAMQCIFGIDELRDEVCAAARATTAQKRGVTFSRSAGPATLSAGGNGMVYEAPLSGEVPTGVSVRLDPRFVVDAIDGAKAAWRGPLLAFETTDKQSAVIIRAGAGEKATGDETGFAAVVMPLGDD